MKAKAATFLLASLMLAGCAAAPPGSPSSSAVHSVPSGASTYSRLAPAGIKQITTSKAARFDMTSGVLTKESVGLKSGSSQAPDVSPPDGMMELSIVIVHVHPA